VPTARGGRVTSTYDGVTERPFGCSRFLIARPGAKDSDVLVLRLPDGHTALPVFASEEEAGMFLWLETAGDGWRVAEISEADLAGLLRDSCAGVRRVVRPFAADTAGKGPAGVDREDFLRALAGERSRRSERRGEGVGHKFQPRTSARKGEGFW
jgi:hypothetical protein